MLDIENKRILVLGLGVSGYAAAKFLTEKGCSLSISDNGDSPEIKKRAEELSQEGAGCEFGGHSQAFFKEADIVVVSPGVDTRPLCSSGVLPADSTLISTLELGYMFCKSPIIGVTGTNGKSTVTELIGSMISGSGRHTVVCGNIGNPLIGEVKNLTEKSIAIVEVSSFQLEAVREFRPRIAIVLNVAEDHYDRHSGYDEYKRSKFKIFDNQKENDWALLHYSLREDPLTGDILSKKLYFGREGDSAKVYDNAVIIDTAGVSEEIKVGEGISLKGAHNVANIACAALAARIIGVEKDVIQKAVTDFKILGHRFEFIDNIRNIDLIDDSKATNIDATRCALESLDKKVTLIAGGRDKGGDYASISRTIKEKVRTLVLIGEASERIKDAFGSIVPSVRAKDMKEAVSLAFENARAGEAIMLSPMCSSFDMFSSYSERGEAFKREVRAIARNQ